MDLLEYDDVLREERQLCTLVAHLLWSSAENVEAFLQLVREAGGTSGYDGPIEETRVYVEFAYLRDWWHQLANDAERRRGLREALGAAGLAQHISRLDGDTRTVNSHFVQGRNATARTVVSPTLWSIQKLDEIAGSNEDFARLCKFKWCFNAKPDVVLTHPYGWNVVVEAKLESGESWYPARSEDAGPFERRFGKGKGRVGQIEVQRFMFESILQRPVTQVTIGPSAVAPRGTGHERVLALTWAALWPRFKATGDLTHVPKLLNVFQTARRRTT